MRLSAFQIKNYKTVMDSGKVETDPNVTCLMGKNEAGKSAIMQALWKFNNVSDAKYDPLHDLPAELYSRLRHDDPEVVVLEFALEGDDVSQFAEQFPTIGTAPAKITVRSTYSGQRTVEFDLAYTSPTYGPCASWVSSALSVLAPLDSETATPDAEELAAIRFAYSRLDTLHQAAAPDLSASSLSRELILTAILAVTKVPPAKLYGIAEPLVKALRTFAGKTREESEVAVREWFLQRLPVFIYFEDYGRLKTRIHLPTFVPQIQSPPKDTETQMLFRTQLAMFEWAHLDANELQHLGLPIQEGEKQEVVERRKAERARILESASYHLSGDWVEWWDQRTHNLRITADGDDLELRVSDSINPWEIAFGERSRGFQWFFSFYLTFLVESGKAHKGAIILLDEPGLHLHPTAQEKLLGFFQKISTKNQLLYSSHSMFMVDPDHVDNVRTVYLQPTKPQGGRSRAYTRVSRTADLEGDRDTLLPMQAAGAYRLAQTLSIGKRTLIVEGIADYWLLRTLSQCLGSAGQTRLHEETVLLWAGGISSLLPLASVMSAREQTGANRMAVLLDSDRVGLQKVRRLVSMLAHGVDSVLLLGEILGIKAAEGEDLLEFDELVDGLMLLGRLPTIVPTANPGETNVPLLRRLFAENGWGELTHEEKAKLILALTDRWWTGTASPAPRTLTRATQLFGEVNARFERLLSMEATPTRAVGPMTI